MSKNRISRRQFLNYTLTGVGGFMAAGMLMPMVRFAVDPVLKHMVQVILLQHHKKLLRLLKIQHELILLLNKRMHGTNQK